MNIIGGRDRKYGTNWTTTHLLIQDERKSENSLQQIYFSVNMRTTDKLIFHPCTLLSSYSPIHKLITPFICPIIYASIPPFNHPPMRSSHRFFHFAVFSNTKIARFKSILLTHRPKEIFCSCCMQVVPHLTTLSTD